MAGYVKELLLDLPLGKLSIEMQSDLELAVKAVFRTGLFSRIEKYMFYLYLAGYTAEEIAARYQQTTDTIETTLSRIFIAIETLSGYSDHAFIQRAKLKYKARTNKIRDLEALLIKHTKHYDTHSIGEIE